MAATLQERLGGAGAIDAFSTSLFEHLLGDAELGPRFAGTNMDRQRKAFAAVLRAAAGGEDEEAAAIRPQLAEYIERSHADQGITGREFTRTAYYAGVVAGQLGVQQPELGEIIGVVQSTEPLVIAHMGETGGAQPA